MNGQPNTEQFSLQRRDPNGGTPPLTNWGFRNETDPLIDVLLGPPENLYHRAHQACPANTCEKALVICNLHRHNMQL